MRIGLYTAGVALAALLQAASAESVTYEALGQWIDPQHATYSDWESRLRLAEERSVQPESPGTRPTLPGLRPRNVELLEDAFLRKHPKLLRGNPTMARQAIHGRYEKAIGPLRGYMAEAMFIDRNTDWHYVAKPNASQNDVYRWRDGKRAPFTGQIKYHISGDPVLYAQDMVKDHRAPRFFIPDDHVEATKAYLRDQAEGLQRSGDHVGAKALWRDYGRLRGIGATSMDVQNATDEVGRYVSAEYRVSQVAATQRRYAAYTSLGAIVSLSLVPVIVDLADGDLTADRAALHTFRSTSLIGAQYATGRLITSTHGGLLRGTAAGNVLVASVLTVVDVAWITTEYGGMRAFTQPAFYERSACSVGNMALGWPVGIKVTALAAEFGPWAPLLGAGAFLAAGSAGCFLGATATYLLIEVFKPEWHRREEQERLDSVRDLLDAKMKAARDI